MHLSREATGALRCSAPGQSRRECSVAFQVRVNRASNRLTGGRVRVREPRCPLRAIALVARRGRSSRVASTLCEEARWSKVRLDFLRPIRLVARATVAPSIRRTAGPTSMDRSGPGPSTRVFAYSSARKRLHFGPRAAFSAPANDSARSTHFRAARGRG